MVYKASALILALSGFLASVTLVFHYWFPYEESYLADCYEFGSIVVVPIYGDIAWGVAASETSVYGSDVDLVLNEINNSDFYAGVVIDMDSYGGYPVASFRLGEKIRSLGLPTATVVGDSALSGGYAIAAASDRIFIHPLSEVGSIGVTSSYVSEYKANESLGYNYESLSTGLFKDTGDPAKELTEIERGFMMKDLNEAHDYFVSLIAKYRNIPVETVSRLADGRWYTGQEAIELGLADEFGDLDVAIGYIRERTGEYNPVCYLPVL